MGAENRPHLFEGKIMSVVSQFQSFLFQMVGLYGDALIKSAGGRMDNLSLQDRALTQRMAMKQLAAMSLTMMAFGGAMGLPFMENLKQLIQFITEKFGDQVGTDFEQELRNVLGDTMGYDAADAFIRGIPRLLGADISRRAAYGEVIPIRMLTGGDPADMVGPAGARAADMVRNTYNSLNNGNFLEAAIGVLPIAAQNVYEATYKEPTYGTFTQNGQQLLPPGSLSGTEQVLKAIGFTPTEVSRAREARGLQNYLTYRSRSGRDFYTDRMTKNYGAFINALQKGDGEAASNFLSKYYTDYLKTMQHDLNHIFEPSAQYRINYNTPIDRYVRGQQPFAARDRLPVAVRPEYQMMQRKDQAYGG